MPLDVYAYTLGIVELLLGVPLLVRPGPAGQWLLRLRSDDVAIRMVAAFFFVLSFLALVDDPSIGADSAGLIRLVAWAAAVRSLFYCWWAGRLASLSGRFLEIPLVGRLTGLAATAIGILLIALARAL